MREAHNARQRPARAVSDLIVLLVGDLLEPELAPLGSGHDLVDLGGKKPDRDQGKLVGKKMVVSGVRGQRGREKRRISRVSPLVCSSERWGGKPLQGSWPASPLSEIEIEINTHANDEAPSLVRRPRHPRRLARRRPSPARPPVRRASASLQHWREAEAGPVRPHRPFASRAVPSRFPPASRLEAPSRPRGGRHGGRLHRCPRAPHRHHTGSVATNSSHSVPLARPGWARLQSLQCRRLVSREKKKKRNRDRDRSRARDLEAAEGRKPFSGERESARRRSASAMFSGVSESDDDFRVNPSQLAMEVRIHCVSLPRRNPPLISDRV